MRRATRFLLGNRCCGMEFWRAHTGVTSCPFRRRGHRDFVFTLISITVSVVMGATMYLIVFNRPRRQGVHDLAVGSFVADADMIGPLKLEPTWKMHWVILAVLAILLFASGKLVENRLEKWGPMPQLLADVRLVEGMDGVQRARGSGLELEELT